jgi:NAD(P)H-dependent nitrite reductase small subunit
MNHTSHFSRLISIDQCRRGSGTFVECGDRELAVFRLDDNRFAVIDNACPHASGNLSGGQLSGDIVTCPWHEWQFDVTSGQCTLSPAAKVNCYPVIIRDGAIYVDLDAPL